MVRGVTGFMLSSRFTFSELMAAANPSALVQPPASVEATNDLRPIKPPVEIASGWEWVWWALGVLVLVALALFLWRWLQRKSIPLPTPPVPPHVRAKQKLAEALRLIADPRAFCTAVSDTLRVYLEERFDFHAPERTTDEFLVELQGTKLLLPDQKQSLGEFLQSCDLVKFARFEPTESALRALHDAALRLVDATQFDPIASAPPPAAAPPAVLSNQP